VGVIDDIFRPLFELLAGLLSLFYSWVPNYAIAIGMLTLVVMVVILPLTLKSTKSMLQMQAIQPRLKEVQKQYQGDRQAMTVAQQEVMKEAGVSPLGGCLPMLLQFPLLFVIYDLIEGLAKTVKTKSGRVIATPRYIAHNSLLYKNLLASHGAMRSFGLNLSLSPLSQHNGFFAALPYYVLVLVSVGLQFIQVQQIISKNPSAASANPSAKLLQQGMTVVFGFIYLEVPAGVVVYFLVSGAFRIVQQELMWRHDPMMREYSQESRRKAAEKKGGTVVVEGNDLTDFNPKQLRSSSVNPVGAARRPKKRGLKGLILRGGADDGADEMPKPPPRRPQANRSKKKRKRR